MCGIVGYIGKKDAVPFLLDGLGRLEYRGYDSAGVAVLKEQKVKQVKTQGRLKVLKDILQDNPLSSSVGIAHTRWATHGVPSDVNAHPHCCCKGEISLIHNGIIENYVAIRNRLIEKGHVFQSATDTEVLVHLIEEYFEGDILKAVLKALKDVEGAYAIGVLSARDPGRIIGARLGSPLVTGLSKHGSFLGSDIPAFLPYTREVKYIKEKEVVELTPNKVNIYDLDGNFIDRKSEMVLWDASMAEKSGYKHFMLKEIFEQPRAISDTLSGRLFKDEIRIDEMKLSDEELRSVDRVLITACGTAYHASMIGKYMLEALARIPVETEVASELRYRDPVINEKTLVVAVTQSGETADTLVSFRDAINRGAKSVAVTNVVGSSITRETENIIFTRAGLEIGVAATKTYTCQITALALLSLKLAKVRGTMSEEDFEKMAQDLSHVPPLMEEILKKSENIRHIARRFHKARDFLFLGRSVSYPVALEGALKLKEISYIHAEGYASGEMKHGPIALIDRNVPVVIIMPCDGVCDKTLSNVQEVRAREGVTIGITNHSPEEMKTHFDEVVPVPSVHPLLSPLLTTIPLQLLAYYIADRKNRDVDQPRNLAKSVTVE